jgi:hypothetical protein
MSEVLPSAARDTTTPESRLISYASAGLRRCWIPDLGRYSFRYRFDVSQRQANESVAEGEAFYTLNVLLGLSRLPTAHRFEYLDSKDVYNGCCAALGSPGTRPYSLGMALWAGALLGIEPPSMLLDRVNAILASARRLLRCTAQDIGMLLSGASAMALASGGHWRRAAETLAFHLAKNYRDPSTHIFYNAGLGYRRRFASFASQVYPILSLYQFGEALAQQWAIRLADEGASQMIRLQGPRGEWGWFYYVPQARTVDFYEVYSVHQHGMAPAFLHHAVAHGVPGAREALVKGFLWLFGDNEIGASMLRPNERMFYRSQVRAGELGSTLPRVRRSIVNAGLGRSDTAGNHRGLVLRQECRSYELGWILWSFGDRSDYPELTERREFAD